MDPPPHFQDKLATFRMHWALFRKTNSPRKKQKSLKMGSRGEGCLLK